MGISRGSTHRHAQTAGDLHPYLTCHNAQIKEISFLVRTLSVRTTCLRVLQLLLLKNNKINMDCNIYEYMYCSLPLPPKVDNAKRRLVPLKLSHNELLQVFGTLECIVLHNSGVMSLCVLQFSR